MSSEQPQSNYVITSKVGGGVYGDVYKAKHSKSGQIVAIKKIKKHQYDQGISSVALRESAILQTLHHPNIIRLLDIEYRNGCIWLVMEYYEIDLYSYLKQQILDEHQIKFILHDILLGLAECHRFKCMHRDLKPQNILLTQTKQAKICDFGMARFYQKAQDAFSKEVITLWYRPPELLLGCSKYSSAVDIWSVGCIFAEMILRQPLFPGESEIQQTRLIFNNIQLRFKEPIEEQANQEEIFTDNQQHIFENQLQLKFSQSNISLEGFDLLKKLLQLDPQKRIGSFEALQHPYFDDINKPNLSNNNQNIVYDFKEYFY